MLKKILCLLTTVLLTINVFPIISFAETPGIISVDNVVFLDANTMTPVQCVKDGEAIKVSADFENKSEIEANALMLVCVYNSEEQMIYCDYNKVSLSEKQKETFFVDTCALKDDEKVRVYFWDNIKSMKKIAESADLTAGNTAIKEVLINGNKAEITDDGAVYDISEKEYNGEIPDIYIKTCDSSTKVECLSELSANTGFAAYLLTAANGEERIFKIKIKKEDKVLYNYTFEDGAISPEGNSKTFDSYDSNNMGVIDDPTETGFGKVLKVYGSTYQEYPSLRALNIPLEAAETREFKFDGSIYIHEADNAVNHALQMRCTSDGSNRINIVSFSNKKIMIVSNANSSSGTSPSIGIGEYENDTWLKYEVSMKFSEDYKSADVKLRVLGEELRDNAGNYVSVIEYLAESVDAQKMFSAGDDTFSLFSNSYVSKNSSDYYLIDNIRWYCPVKDENFENLSSDTDLEYIAYDYGKEVKYVDLETADNNTFTIVLPYGTQYVKTDAKTSNEKAYLILDNKEISDFENTKSVKIKVFAENGDEKIYTINYEVAEKNEVLFKYDFETEMPGALIPMSSSSIIPTGKVVKWSSVSNVYCKNDSTQDNNKVAEYSLAKFQKYPNMHLYLRVDTEKTTVISGRVYINNAENETPIQKPSFYLQLRGINSAFRPAVLNISTEGISAYQSAVLGRIENNKWIDYQVVFTYSSDLEKVNVKSIVKADEGLTDAKGESVNRLEYTTDIDVSTYNLSDNSGFNIVHNSSFAGDKNVTESRAYIYLDDVQAVQYDDVENIEFLSLPDVSFFDKPVQTSNSVNISGNCDKNICKIPVLICDKDISMNNLVSDIENNRKLRVIYAGEIDCKEGNFSYEIPLLEGTQTGNYLICLSDDINNSIKFINETAKLEAIRNVCDGVKNLNKEQIKIGLLGFENFNLKFENKFKLISDAGLDNIIDNLIKNDIFDYSDMIIGGDLFSDFVEEIDKEILMELICENKLSDISEILLFTENHNESKPDIYLLAVSAYKNGSIKDNSDGDIISLISGVKYDSFSKLCEGLGDAIAINSIKNAEVGKLQTNIVNLFGDYFDLDFSEFDKLTSLQQADILKKLSEEEIERKEDVKSKFNNIVSSYEAKPIIENNKNSGGSAGGGGGGGTKNSFAVSPNIEINNISLSGVNADNSTRGFADIYDAEWAREYILYLNDKNIINGYENGMFKPNNPITRAEAVKIIVSAIYGEDYKAMNDSLTFKDVSENDWYYNYICFAVNNNIVSGFSKEKFGSDENITRQDFAKILYNADKKMLITEDKANDINFTDKNDIAEYAYEAVETLFNKKIISGFEDGSFKPNDNITRAECAKMIFSLLNN